MRKPKVEDKYNLKQDIEKIKDFLIKNKSVAGIYPNYLMKKFSLTANELLSACIVLQHEGILTPMYETRCPSCIRQLDIYETFSQVPENGECTYCGEGAIGMDNIMVYFKIVKN